MERHRSFPVTRHELEPSRRDWLVRAGACAVLLPAGVSLAACGRAGSQAPPFETTTQYGRHVSLQDFRGKLFLLTFWATWCPYCRTQLVAMDQLASGYESAKVSLLALSVDAEGWDAVRPYLGQAGHTFPVGIADNRTRRAYGTSGGIPVTYVINSEGILQTDVVGGLDLAALRDLVATYGV